MHTLPWMLLALLSLSPALAPHDQPAADATATTTTATMTTAPAESLAGPLQVVALDDCLDFLVLLDDPDVRTEVVGIVEYPDRTFVAAVHEYVHRSRGVGTWAVIYTFPPTIFTHSIVQVPFHAEEMK